MAARRLNAKKLFLPVLLGTIILEVILVFSAGTNDFFSVHQIPSHLIAITIGALGGWIFEVFKDLLAATNESLDQVEILRSGVAALSARIKYQDAALEMLTNCPQQNEALSVLIKISMTDNFRNIPFVPVASYLHILEIATKHSNGFEGVQRQSIRWYRDSGSSGYLEALRDKPMSVKTRLFVLDASSQRDMDEDLADPSLLDWYWWHTGAAVNSFYVAESDFRKNFPQIPIPGDFALYDRELFVMYDEDRQILSFDVVGESSNQVRIFKDLGQLVKSHADSAFKRVPRAPNEV